MAQDYYEILGVSRDADEPTIKKAYRKKAMQYHPDKNPGDSVAEGKFKEAAEAYEVLGNQEKKARYDRFGHAAFSQAGAGGPGFSDVGDIFESFSDIFGDFFGGGSRQQRRKSRNQPRRGADLRYLCEIDLEQVINGIEKEVSFEAEENCQPCNGSGAAKGSQPEVCSTCGGSGQVVRAQGFFSVATTCPQCAGEGVIIKSPCHDCQGKGRQLKSRKIRVTIPPGVDTGTRLRVASEGEGGFRGGPAGDLYVEVRVREHRDFVRRGDDLLGEIKVSYVQAALGTEIDVPVIKEKSGKNSVTLKVPKGTQPGDTLRLASAGIPHLRGGGRGDLYLEVKVSIPKKLKKDEEKLLRELATLNKDKVAGKKNGFFS